MELVYCPECQGYSSPGVCQHCGKPIPEDAAAALPSIAAKPPDPPPAPEPPPPEEVPAPPPFEAPPELLARASALLAAIEQEPAGKTPYLQLSQLYAERKRRDLAAAILERFLAVDPNDANVKHRLAQLAKRDAPASAATPASTATPAPRPAAARPATIPPRQVYSPAGVAHRPPPPMIRREFQGLTSRSKAIVGGVLGGAALLWAVMVYVFPGTRRLAGGEFRAYGPSFSPTGKQLAFLIDDGRSTQLAVHDLGRGAHRNLAPVAGREFAWSPDGARIAYSSGAGGDDWRSSIFVVDVASGQSRKLAAGSAPAWSGSSTLIAVCSPEPPSVSEDEPNPYLESDFRERYCRIDVSTGAVSRTRLAVEYGMAVSGSVDSVVYEQAKESPGVASAESPEKEAERFVDRLVAGGARNVAEGSRDLNRELEAKRYEERRRAAGKSTRLPYEADIVVASLDGGSATLLTSGGQSAFPSWTADGRILYATNGAAGIEMWSMTALGADKKAVLRGTKLADPSAVKVTRDGRQVFFVAPVEGDPGIAKAMTGEDPADIHVAPVGGSGGARLANRHPFKQRFAVSPDGSRIAYEVLQDVKVIGGAGKSEIWLMRR